MDIYIALSKYKACMAELTGDGCEMSCDDCPHDLPIRIFSAIRSIDNYDPLED